MINLHPKSGYSWENFLEKDFFEGVLRRLITGLGIERFYFEFYLHRDQSIDSISSSFNQTNIKKVLFILCDEHNDIKSTYVKGFDFVFKTYLSSEASDFIPLPVGYNSEINEQPILDIINRNYNVFFSGNLNTNRLVGLYKALHKLTFLPTEVFLYLYKRPGLQRLFHVAFPKYFTWKKSNNYICFTEGFNSGLSKVEYAEKLSQSKIALCPKGFVSAETFRLHEALRQGCLVICEKLPNHSFYKDAPFFQIDNWKNLSKQLDSIFQMNLNNLQEKSISYYQEHLSEAATAAYIVKHINNIDN